MPLPKSTDPGTIIKFLKRKGEKKRPHKQIIAIALSQARKSGAHISIRKSLKKRFKK